MDAMQVAKNQPVFREANERVRRLNNEAEHMDLGDLDECFTCECARRNCKERMMSSLDAYEEIRRVPTHFGYCSPDEPRFPGRRAGLRDVSRVLGGREVR